MSNQLDQLNKAMEALEEELSIEQKVSARVLLTMLVDNTPVITGRARNNWNVSLGAPDLHCNPGDPYFPSFDKTGTEVKNRGYAVIDKAKIGQDVYISNTVYVTNPDTGKTSYYMGDILNKHKGLVERAVLSVVHKTGTASALSDQFRATVKHRNYTAFTNDQSILPKRID